VLAPKAQSSWSRHGVGKSTSDTMWRRSWRVAADQPATEASYRAGLPPAAQLQESETDVDADNGKLVYEDISADNGKLVYEDISADAVELDSAKHELCPICHDEIGTGASATTGCKHHYHHPCLEKWKDFSRGQFRVFRCPVCRVPLDDDFEVCDEPPPEPEHQLSAPTTIYFAGPVGMGFMSYIPPDAVMTEWTTIIRPYSPRPPRGSTRIERGNQSMADRFGEFAFSALNGLFGSPPPEPPSTGIRFTEAEQRAMSHYIAWHA